MRLYHFTAYYHLPAIIAAGTLRTTESNLSVERPHAGPDCVWFLDGPDLGEADHGLAGDRSALDKRAVRIVCDVPDYKVIRWAAWARQKADALTVASMVDTGGGEAAAVRWLVTLGPVRSDRWAAIEDARSGDTLWQSGEPLGVALERAGQMIAVERERVASVRVSVGKYGERLARA